VRTESSAEVSRKSKKELARRLRSDPGLEVVHPDAAGIDVGNESHYVAVRPDRAMQLTSFREKYFVASAGLVNAGVRA
jgi:hypothetical protein